MKLQALLMILCCGAAFGQSQSKLTIDYTENSRWCRDDSAVKRQCNVAYGHYTVTEAPEWHTKPTTYRIVLLCQPAGQELGRKDCIPLEANTSYEWGYAHRYGRPDDGYWYELYEDYLVVVVVKTPNGNANYTMKIINPERK